MARGGLPPLAVALVRRRERYAFSITALAVFLWGLVVAAHYVARPGASPGPAPGVSRGETTALSEEQSVADCAYEVAQQAAAAAHERAERARRALADFLAEHFAGHVTEAERLVRTAPSAPAPPPAPAAIEVTDPMRQALLERQQSLLARRDELTTRVTPAHPEVQDVELRLAEVGAELARLASRAQTEGPLTVDMPRAPAKTAPSAPLGERDEQLQQLRQAVSSFESVQYEFDLARRELVESEAQLHGAADECTRIAAARAVAAEASAATTAAAEPRALSPWSACWAALSLSLVAGGAVALCAAPATPAPLSLSDLGPPDCAPLLGSLPDASSAPLALPSPPWAKLIVLAAEVAVAAFVFAIIAQSVRNTGFLAQLAARPLPAILEAYQQLRASIP